MTINLEILDFKTLKESQWVLCKGNLMEYLEKLKPSFYEYIIQRKIVKNKYLNTLVHTVIMGEPVPIITLTKTKEITDLKNKKVINVEMNDVEILDGLQRTFRLWAYYKIISEYKKAGDISAIDFAKNIKQEYPEFFDSGLITLTLIKEYIKTNKFQEIEGSFKKFDIYFFIWTGLSGKKVIHKMLVLNAGQRPVSLTHQYELLFLYVWEEVKATSGIKLYREKDPAANKIKLGDRKAGEYMFSSVIAALRSFLENKPKRLSIDDLDIEDLRQGESGSQINEEVFSKPYIESFLNHLKTTDEAVIEKEKEDGRKWFVRDTSLSGILAGLGKYVAVKETMHIDEIDQKTNEGFDKLIVIIKNKGFALEEFQKEYYNLQSRTVNVGTYVRKIIMDYTYQLLNNEVVNWKSLFDQSKTKN